jgi:outer membrane protein OmpA-like peptidoglycan-associated protein
MSFDPIESVKAVFSGELMNKMAGVLGESSANVQQAMQGIIPSVVTGLLLKTEFGDVHDTLNLAKEAAKIEIPFNQTSLTWWWNTNYKGLDYLKSLFGEKKSRLTDAIADYAGVSTKSASSLLNIVAPAAYSVLGKHVLNTNMNVSGLRHFFNNEKKKILNSLPAGIFLEGIMGFENLSGLSAKFSSIENPAIRKKSGSKWVLLLILIVLASGAVWYFLNKPSPAETPTYTVVHKGKPSKDTVATLSVVRDQYSVKLPDGKILNVKKGGIEDQLIIFFNDPKSRPSRRYPFNFDQLNFNEGTDIISNESLNQIQNIALILESYPKARIKIGGFNEKGGDSLLNRTLSHKKAIAVSNALKAAGTNPNQIAGVEGFGSDFAKYAAEAADSLKEKDKRIAISIRAK